MQRGTRGEPTVARGLRGQLSRSRMYSGPCLSESSLLRFIVLAMLYAAQGIPDAMVLILLPAYLAGHGVEPANIGMFLAIALAPNSAKLLSGPLIDRLSFRPMGRRRPWIMLGQAGIGASFVFLATLQSPAEQFELLTASAFMIVLATVFQDVATDGLAMDLVPPSEQGKANGVMWGSKTLGTAVFASLGAVIMNLMDFPTMALAAAVILIAVLALLMLVRERPGERLLPWSKGEAAEESIRASVTGWKELVLLLTGALRRPAAIRLLGVSISIGLILGLAGTLLPVLFIQRLGWEETDYANLRSTLKLVSGVAGMVIGGFLIDRLGPQRLLWMLFFALALANVAMILLWQNLPAWGYLVIAELALVFVFIAFFAATMRQCLAQIAATQFSVTMVCGNMGMVVGAAALGPLDALGGLGASFSALALICLLAAMMGGTIIFDDSAR